MVRALKRSFFVALFSPLFAFAQDYAPGEIIVKMQSGTTSAKHAAFMKRAANTHGLQLKRSFNKFGMHHFAVPEGKSVADTLQNLKSDPDVAYAEPNYYFRVSTAPTGLHQTFSAEQMQAESAQTASGQMTTSAPIKLADVWGSSHGPTGHRPIVAVIDTGLDVSHPVIHGTAALWVNPGELENNGIDDEKNGYIDDRYGYNFVDNSSNIMDDEGHGTHVSGIILGVDQNIFAATLRPSRVQIMPLKFLNAQGVGLTSDAIRAVYYAVDNGATVLNNSWGGPSYSAALQDAIAYSYSHGAVFVAAAGNSAADNDSVPSYPANYDVPNVISVAATDDTGTLASFSDYGKNSVHLGSPGVYILSTLPGNTYGLMSGTSMATPFVSATAALIQAESAKMLGYQVKSILMNQATPDPQLNGKVVSSGNLDPAMAMNTALSVAVSAVQPAYTAVYQTDADRGPASASQAGGCDLVKSVKNDYSPLTAVAVVSMLLLQVIGLLILRLRAQRNARPVGISPARD